ERPLAARRRTVGRASRRTDGRGRCHVGPLDVAASMTLVPGTDRIESERLLLRRITGDDYDFFARLQGTPDVVRYKLGGRPRSAEESRAWVERVAMYQRPNLGFLAVVRKSDGRLIGRCGLSELVVAANAAPGTVPRGWFERDQAPADTELRETPDLG